MKKEINLFVNKYNKFILTVKQIFDGKIINFGSKICKAKNEQNQKHRNNDY